MKKLNEKEIESLKIKITSELPILDLSFNDTLEKEENGIYYIILERYNYQMKIIYVVVPLSSEQQYDRIPELEGIAKKIVDSRGANFGYYGTCSFENEKAIVLHPTFHQIEILKKH